MASITLKNFPDDLRLALKARAKLSGRSLNQEIIQALRIDVVDRPARDRKAVEARIEENLLQQAATGVWITDEEINRWKREGRP